MDTVTATEAEQYEAQQYEAQQYTAQQYLKHSGKAGGRHPRMPPSFCLPTLPGTLCCRRPRVSRGYPRENVSCGSRGVCTGIPSRAIWRLRDLMIESRSDSESPPQMP
jgi:hypothetical protein